jgi:hypothetical protein
LVSQPPGFSAAAAIGGAAGGGGSAGAVVSGGMVGVVDPDEPKKLQKVRQRLQDLRVGLLRSASRLGLPSQHEAVSQYVTVLDKLEKMQQPIAGPKRRVDVDRLAYQTAQELNSSQPPDSKLGVQVSAGFCMQCLRVKHTLLGVFKFFFPCSK